MNIIHMVSTDLTFVWSMFIFEPLNTASRKAIFFPPPHQLHFPSVHPACVQSHIVSGLP